MIMVSTNSSTTATTLDLNSDSVGERLERMRSEFLAAQQRRRDRAKPGTTRPDDTDDGPLTGDPADEKVSGIATVRAVILAAVLPLRCAFRDSAGCYAAIQ
jgi:hypothetical protein